MNIRKRPLLICCGAAVLLAAAGSASGVQSDSKKSGDGKEKKSEPYQIKKLTQEMGLQMLGPVSPDGKTILLTAKKPDKSPNLYVMDLATYGIRPPLTDFSWGVVDPAWSPDGQLVAFAGFNETASFADIYIVDVGTGKIRQITKNSFSDKEPVFSPDGKNLFFTTDESPLPEAAFGILHVAIVPLSRGKAESFAQDEGSSVQPKVSQDGSIVLLVKVDEHSGRHSLWEYSREGKPLRELTGRKLARIHRYVIVSGGHKIVLSGQEEPEQEEFIYVLDVASGQLRPLPDPDTPKVNPTVSPDGRLIAYVAPTGHGKQLFLYDSSTDQIQQLTSKGPHVFTPAFVSNTVILFGGVRDSANGNEIYLLDLASPAAEDKKDGKKKENDDKSHKKE